MPRNKECRCTVPVLTIAILLEIALSLCAAMPPTQTLKGQVLGDKNTPIAGAACTLVGPGLPEEGRTQTTGENGGFEFTGLTPGSYDLTCAALGYEPLIQKDIGIAEGQAPFVQVVLPREVVVHQKVEVKEKAPAVSLETTAPPATISSGELRTLPLVEQKFLAALPLVPGVIRTPDGKINIKGVTENQGMLLIDSAETVDPVTGSFSIQVPLDAVESVEVQKTAYQAQYGRFTGGLTSVQTKAPLDRWNWELNDFLPSLRIKSGQIVGISDDSPRLSFTGPILSDKLSFSESIMYDLNKQPVRGLAWPHNEIKKQGVRFVHGSLLRFFPPKSRDRQLEGVSVARAIRQYRLFHTAVRILRLCAERILSWRYRQVHVLRRRGADDPLPVHRLRQLCARARFTGYDPDAGQLGRKLLQRLDSG